MNSFRKPMGKRPNNTLPADPFPKWKWMMDYCKKHKLHPSDYWHIAEVAYQARDL